MSVILPRMLTQVLACKQLIAQGARVNHHICATAIPRCRRCRKGLLEEPGSKNPLVHLRVQAKEAHRRTQPKPAGPQFLTERFFVEQRSELLVNLIGV